MMCRRRLSNVEDSQAIVNQCREKKNLYGRQEVSINAKEISGHLEAQKDVTDFELYGKKTMDAKGVLAVITKLR